MERGPTVQLTHNQAARPKADRLEQANKQFLQRQPEEEGARCLDSFLPHGERGRREVGWVLLVLFQTQKEE